LVTAIGTNLLACRLRDLEEVGVVERQVLPPPAGSTVYALTRRGQALEPAIVALVRFGGRFLPERPDTEVFRARWTVISLKITFNAWQANGVRADDRLKLDGEPIGSESQQGEAERANLTIRTTGRACLICWVGTSASARRSCRAGRDRGPDRGPGAVRPDIRMGRGANDAVQRNRARRSDRDVPAAPTGRRVDQSQGTHAARSGRAQFPDRKVAVSARQARRIQRR
jgi:hypothetical protein